MQGWGATLATGGIALFIVAALGVISPAGTGLAAVGAAAVVIAGAVFIAAGLIVEGFREALQDALATSSQDAAAMDRLGIVRIGNEYRHRGARYRTLKDAADAAGRVGG